MLDSPATTVRARIAPQTEIVFPATIAEQTKAFLEAAISRFLRLASGAGVLVEIRTPIPEHIGLGSKTAMTLAALAAAARTMDLKISRLALQRLSGRGGASGVGVHGFFLGGFVVDAGRLGTVPLQPSAYQVEMDVPTLIRAAPMPADWVATLVLPPGIKISGEAELRFFQDVTPIPRQEILEQMAVFYHGLVPAILEGDLETFGSALDSFSRLGFKAREIEAQGSNVAETISVLRDVAPCAGMSSMGPLVFAISKGSIMNQLPAFPAGTVIIGETGFAEGGFKIQDG